MSDISKSKTLNSKVALRAGVWYVVSSVLVRMVSVITTPIFTRMLSTDEYGVVSTFSAWYSLFLVIYSLNLTVSIGRAKLDYPDKLDEYIGSMQLLSLLVSIAISIFIIIFIKPLSVFFDLSVPATFLLVIYLIATPSINFFQSGYRYKYLYKQNIALAWYTTISTVALSLFLIFYVDADKALLRMIGLVIPTVVLSLVFWGKSIKNRHAKINIEFWRYGVNISLPMILHTISMNILSGSDRIVISQYCGSTPVALYSLVQNYAILIMVVTEAINQAWQPWFHDNFFLGKNEEIKKNVKSLIVFICYMGVACIAIGPEAIMILGGKQYTDAVHCIPPLVMGVVCQCTYTHYVNIELHMKKTKYAVEGTMIAAGLNVLLNVIFVPQVGYWAAAYTTFASYCVLLILHCLITRMRLKIKVYDDTFMFIAMIITSIIAFFISTIYDTVALRWSVIAVGFLSFLFVFRNYVLNIIKKRIKKVKMLCDKPF